MLREREREATVVVSQKEKRLTRDLLGRKTRAREPKPEDEEDQGTQTTELSWVGGEAKEPGGRTEPKGVSDREEAPPPARAQIRLPSAAATGEGQTTGGPEPHAVSPPDQTDSHGTSSSLRVHY